MQRQRRINGQCQKHPRGQHPAGHKLDLAPTPAAVEPWESRPGPRRSKATQGRRAAVAVTSGYDGSAGISARSTRAVVAGERCIDYTLVCEDRLASPAPEKHGPTLTRY